MRHEIIPLGMNVPQIAEAFAASGLFDDARDMAKAITKIIAGRDYGLGPVASMSGLHVMKGKVEIGAHVIAGGIKASGKYNYRIEVKSPEVCRIRFLERDDAGKWEAVGVEEFTIADAQQAGLSGSQNYKKYPKNMLYNRCISNGYKTYCPDIFLAGPAYIPGELGGPVAPDGSTAEPGPEKVKPVAVVTKHARNGKAKPTEDEIPMDEPPWRTEEHADAYNACGRACKTLLNLVGECARIEELRGALRILDKKGFVDGPGALVNLTAEVEKELAAISEVKAAPRYSVPE